MKSPSASLCIAFCANGGALPGLHAALSSLLRYCAEPQRLEIHVFTERLEARDLAELDSSVAVYGQKLHFHEAHLESFRLLKPLQGDWMTYHRLLLPGLVPHCDIILYLDADLLFWRFDVLQFLEVDVSNAPFAAGGVGQVGYALEGEFYRSIGLNDNDRAFNAGVLLINARWWRQHDVLGAAMRFGQSHPNRLVSADQTILNALYSRQFLALPANFNYALPPNLVITEAEVDSAIVHFVGSPKPWDFAGFFLHRGRVFWKGEIAKTRFRLSGFVRKYWRIQLGREWAIRRSSAHLILRCLRNLWS